MNFRSVISLLVSLPLASCYYVQGGVSPIGGAYVRVGIDYSEWAEWAEDTGREVPGTELMDTILPRQKVTQGRTGGGFKTNRRARLEHQRDSALSNQRYRP